MSTAIPEQKLKVVLLEEIRNMVQYEELKLCNIEINLIPCTGRNYTGALFKVQLKDEDQRCFELFAKVANIPQEVRKYIPVVEMYERERFLYSDIVDVYDMYQERHRIPNEDRYLFPKYYFSSGMSVEEIIILEDLTAKGYDVADRFTPMDWDYASKAIEQLAKFHALSFTFELDNPKLFSDMVKTKQEHKYSSNKFTEDGTVIYRNKLFTSILEGVSPENAVKLKAFLDNMDEDLWPSQSKIQRRPVLVHGDYRHSNLMIKKENDKIVSIIPVDYQTVFYGSPINDLLYFVFTGSDENFRKEHYQSLMDHYYKSLTDFLSRLNRDIKLIYPREDFDLDLKERTIFGLLLSVFILPYILAEEKPDINKKLEEMTVKQGAVYNERFNGIANDFSKWGYI